MSSFSQNNVSEILRTINKNQYHSPSYPYKSLFHNYNNYNNYNNNNNNKEDKINMDIKKIKEKLNILTDLVICYSKEIDNLKNIILVENKEENKEENNNVNNDKSFMYLILFPCLTYMSYLSYRKLYKK